MVAVNQTSAGPQWHLLFHAYDIATDTPGHLAALRSGDAGARAAAFEHLGSAILHQGTVWTATPPALAAVTAALDDPAVVAGRDPSLADLVGWLGVVLESVGWIEFPDPAPAPPSPEEVGEFMAAFADEEADFGSSVAEALMVHAVLDCRARAGAVAQVVTPLLEHPDVEVRTAAAGTLGHALALAPAARDDVAAALLAPAAGGRDETAARILALRDAGADTSAWLDDPDPAVRACAALGVRTDEATQILLDALVDPAAVMAWFGEKPPQFPMHTHFALLAEVLDRDVPLARLRPAAEALIARSTGYTADHEWGPILRAAFPDVQFTPGVRPDPPRDLTEDQRAILRALVANESLWDPTHGNANLARMRVGLPDDRAEVARLAAGPAGRG